MNARPAARQPRPPALLAGDRHGVPAAGPADSNQMTDVLGILEQADARSFTVRTRDGKLVVIPAGRAIAGKVVPPPPARRRQPSPRPP